MKNSFIEDCVNGISKPSDIHDYIDNWHSDVVDNNETLWHFLGVNSEEYRRFIDNDSAIYDIVNEHIRVLRKEKLNQLKDESR